MPAACGSCRERQEHRALLLLCLTSHPCAGSAAASSTPAAGFLGKAAMKIYILSHREVCLPPKGVPSPSGTPKTPTLALEEAEGTEIVSCAAQEGFRS